MNVKNPKLNTEGYADNTASIAIKRVLKEERKMIMQICPKCRNKVERLLDLSRIDNKTMICDECGTKEALDAVGLTEGSSIREAIIENTKRNPHRSSAYERTKS